MSGRLAAIVTFALLIHAPSAHAQQISGNELYEACQSDDPVLAGFCIGYIISQIEGQSFGAFTVLNQIQEAENAAEINTRIGMFLNYCAPDTASNEQLRDVAINHLRDNPQTRHDPARFEVWRALMAAFPC